MKGMVVVSVVDAVAARLSVFVWVLCRAWQYSG